MAEIKMRFPGGKPKALTLSYDDGVEQDIRLIEMMKNHGLKGTFNLNSGLYRDPETVYPPGTIHRRMTREQVSGLYTKNGMEVAVHGLTHPFLEKLPTALCLQEVLKDRENLEKQFGVIVRGMAYPFGTFSDQVVEILKMAGIVYSRTVVSTGKFDLPTDWLRLPATCHHKDPRLMELAEEFVEAKQPRWGEPMLFYLWGHSYEFEADDNWDVMEQFAACTGGREDIWYATNLEIYDYVTGYRNLVWSTDGKSVWNSSCQDIYLEADGEPVCVHSGERIVL
ncbi:MAG: polysaccharide deacetylase family protein [Candidatus Limivivens sp.]|nr:polysaccharide deacetylase family protein [Candidatus Limivivens sp.]